MLCILIDGSEVAAACSNNSPRFETFNVLLLPRLSVWSEALPRVSCNLNPRDLFAWLMDIDWGILDVLRQNCTAIVTWMSITVNISE
jgi:hypothetical protein